MSPYPVDTKLLPVGIINGVVLGFVLWMFILILMLCSCTSEGGMSAKRVTDTIMPSGLVSEGGSQRRTEGLAHHADYDACLIEHNGVLTISPCNTLSLVRM